MVFRWTGHGRTSGTRTAYLQAGEQTLVRGLRQGDDDAYAALFELYRSRIYNFVARIVRDPEDAKDVTQEVFVKAFRQMPGDDHDLALKPWLYRVATTTCLDHLRARRRRGEPLPVTEELPARGDAYERATMTALVSETLDRMSYRHRLVLVLKDVHGLRHDEIAEILGVSRGATETLLFRARAAFRREFGAPAAEPPARRCPQSRATALAFIAGDSTDAERARALEHSRTCRDCRVVLRRSRRSVVGLTAFLPVLALPHGLSVAGASGAAGAASSPLATGTGGLLAKLGVTLSVKAATVAAATVVVVGAGLTVTKMETARHGRAASRAPVAARPAAAPPQALARAADTDGAPAHRRALPGSGTKRGRGPKSGDVAAGPGRGRGGGLALGRDGETPGRGKAKGHDNVQARGIAVPAGRVAPPGNAFGITRADPPTKGGNGSDEGHGKGPAVKHKPGPAPPGGSDPRGKKQH